MTAKHAPATPLRIDHFFQHAARRINARFQPRTIERHESRWMAAIYIRREMLLNGSRAGGRQ